MRDLFWEKYSLAELNQNEWEALCDGCGRCCLHKLEDIETGEVHFTNVACYLLNTETCQCRDYPHRKTKVPDCQVLTADTISGNTALPPSCAYRLLAEGKTLEAWHPLLSKEDDSVVQAGIAMLGRCISEDEVADDDLEHYLIELNS